MCLMAGCDIQAIVVALPARQQGRPGAGRSANTRIN
jgi:hypothetical protein